MKTIYRWLLILSAIGVGVATYSGYQSSEIGFPIMFMNGILVNFLFWKWCTSFDDKE